MSMGCVLALVIFVALFLSSMPEGSVERQGVDGLFIGSQLSAFAPMPDVEERMMEQIWSNCKLDLLGEKSLMRLVDKNILDENAGSTNRHAGHPARLLVQNTISRKLLAGQSVNENFPSSIFLAPALMPNFQNQVSKTASAPPGQLTSHTLYPSSDAPMTEDNFENFSPNPLPGGDFVPEVNDPSSRYASAPSERKDNKTKTIIITAVVTATVTLSLATCFFCCFYRYLMNKYQFPNGERDDRPLLSVSLNDFSVSSHVDFGHANSFHNNKNGALSLTTEANQNGHTALLNSQTDFQADSLPSAFASLTEPTNAIGHALEPAPSSPVKHSTGTMVSSPPLDPSPTLVNPKAPPAPPKGGPLLPKATPPPKGGPPLPKGPPHPPPSKGSLHPPPPKGPPRPPQPSSSSSADPLPPSHHSTNPFSSDTKTKLKPFFWDKVTANPDQSMVWHQIKSGSFQFNEEMIETLFGYSAKDKHWNDTKKDLATNPSVNRIQILDPKKSQNLAISLKAWNVRVEEICDALMEGNELPIELLQILLRMAPTTDEELKLKLFNDNMALLGPAELFLKTVVNVPFAFKRMEALLLMITLQEESTFVKESLATVEEACKELRNSRLFLKLLEAVLKTGNRMNDGTYRGRAQAFKLDTLLKLSDVKGADGKTTLLHFVVQEIIQSEGQRAMRVARESRSSPSINSDNITDNVSEQSEGQYCTLGLEVVSSLSSELENVKRSAGLDADALTGVVTSLGLRLVKTKEFLNTDMRNLMEESNFHTCLKAFVEHAEADLSYLFEEEKRIRLLVKNTTDYFHGSAGRDEGLRLFVIVRDFMGTLDKVCREVRKAAKKELKVPRQKYSLTSQLIAEPQQLIFPTIKEHHIDDFSSDDE